MSKSSAHAALPLALREMFAGGFEKDLHFFQLLLVLINKSCPIKNVDLVWTEDAPPGRAGLRHITGTTQAIEYACASHIACNNQNPNPRFCRIVSDDGRREAESCAISDKAAEMRVRQTGRTDVYRCHAGLIDIAVPVIAEGRHIATLYSGQVLKVPPSRREFIQIRSQISHLSYINPKQLEEAYWQVPVVTRQEIDETVRILEMFAEYLATCWMRLGEMVLAEQRRVKDLQLQRKEFAQGILEGAVANPARVRELARSIGFSHYPNRVLVVQPDEENALSLDVGFDVSVTRLVHAIEGVCEAVENATVAHSRRRGICVFYYDQGNPGYSNDVRTHSFAQRILQAVAERCSMRVRIGIGRSQSEIHRLQDSYQEARAALAASETSITVYKKPNTFDREISAQLDYLCQALTNLQFQEARAALVAFPMLINRTIGENPECLVMQKQFILSAVEAVLYSLQNIGYGGSPAASFRSEMLEQIGIARTPFQLHESWIAGVERLMNEVNRLYTGKYEKLVERAKSYIDGSIEREGNVSLAEAARHVGVSAGHLSRVFRKVSKVTFERYLMIRRVERAQRLLLDPSSRVSEVAEKCEFCNPAYFARVFRKVAGCSPTEYSKNPLLYRAASHHSYGISAALP